LRCYRSLPDSAAALNLVRQMNEHPAKPSLEWLAELDEVLARRPDNFSKTMMPAKKKLLESMLERGLGVQRKKVAPKNKTESTRGVPKKRMPAKRTRPARG
jgi:hypothetical protein